MDKIQVISIFVSIIILIIVIEFIRRDLLKERYSLVWLGTSIVLMICSVWRSLLDIVARAFGIYYPPSLLFLVAIAFLILLLLNHSVVLSTLTKQNNRLAQEVGMLKTEIEKIKSDRNILIS